jgi:PKD repeat protein
LFIFAVTAPAQNASTIRDVFVNWGDGSSSDLGALSGTQSVAHVYQSAGNFPVTAVITDSSGFTQTVSNSVSVVATPVSTIIITPTVPAAGHPVSVTFQIQVTPPTGVAIQNAVINFGDGTSSQLGGVNGTITVQHTYTGAGSFPVLLTVTDTLGRTTTGSTIVTVS